MFSEVYQMGAISKASRRADEASSRSRAAEQRISYAEHDIRELQGRLNSLTLGCQAMWELLCENTQLTDADIVKRMQEVDLRDGTADGKITRSVQQCPSCNRPSNPRRSRCMYCGGELTGNGEVFDR